MDAFAKRLERRLEEAVCRVCVHRTADGGCTLTERHECPIFEWAKQLADVVQRTGSDRLADYMKEIQDVICPECMQEEDGSCEDRDHLNCPLDLYLGIVVDVLEDELERHQPIQTSSGEVQDARPLVDE
jgi:hypothetical protein